MARYGVTLIVQAGKIPSGQSNFTWLATTDNFPTAAIDGGASSILNGGGNLRCYTDSTKATRLPIEVVTFVTGGTPDIQVWGLSPTLNVASTVYIEADTVATTQPAVGAAFGRDAVWADYAVCLHLNDNSTILDSTGNHTPVMNGVVSSVAGLNGSAIAFSGTQYITIASSTELNNCTGSGQPRTVQTTLNFATSGNTVISEKGNNMSFVAQTNNGAMDFRTNSSSLGTASSAVINDNSWHVVAGRYSGVENTVFNDGVLGSPTSEVSPSDNGNPLVIGSRSGSFGYVGSIQEFKISNLLLSKDRLDSENNNQSSPLTFWTVGAWEDQDSGSGLTVTGTTPNFNYSSIAAGIDLTGSIDITGQTANYTYSVVNGSIDLTGDISVIGLTPNQSYSSVSGIIELGAVISVVGLTPNYNYQGITGEVSLNGEILVSGETPSYSYSAIKGFVTTGEAQAIGTVTSSFASDVYSSGFKPNTITVNFKS